MQIREIGQKQVAGRPGSTSGKTQEIGFSQILQATTAAISLKNRLIGGHLSSHVRTASSHQAADPIFLGTISSEAPTVSDLLTQHPAYKKDPWSIIHADPNQGKPFTRMRHGTEVYLNPQNHELLWASGDPKSNSVSHEQAETTAGPILTVNMAASGSLPPSTQSILLGTISTETPTVSDLLIQHPAYKKDPWSIIHAAPNEGKTFTRMPIGTRVYLDPGTLELTWDVQLEKEGKIEAASIAISEDVTVTAETEEDAFSEALVKAVEPLLGSPYETLDCYEMVVVGLKNMGIRYEGHDGLAAKLVRMAASKGLPTNAYLTGEGLVAVSGQQVYSKTLPKVMSLDKEVEKLYQEMEPLLRRGFILSFSTPTRGHTGIISRKDELWTYINSGNMDHSVMDGRVAKGVGEESLKDELKNWLRLAAERNEPLQITLGRIQEAKIQAYMA